MAGDWIKVECVTPDKPEVDMMANKLGIDHDSVVGKLLRLWIWADQQSISGGELNTTSKMIDRITFQSGFSDALKNVNWLIGDDGCLSLPNFEKHNGQTAKNRADTNRRVAKSRSKKKDGNDKVTNNALLDVNQSKKTLIPRPIRSAVYERDEHTCVYCSRKKGEYSPPEMSSDAKLSLDHVIPEAAGGATCIDNLVTACMSCNQFKGSRTPEECGLPWPSDVTRKRYGSVTNLLQKPLPEKRRDREESILNNNTPPTEGNADQKLLKAVWEIYPQVGRGRSSKKQVATEWKKIKKTDRPTQEAIVESLKGWIACHEWQRDNGQGIQGVHLWIKNERWDNTPTQYTAPSRDLTKPTMS